MPDLRTMRDSGRHTKWSRREGRGLRARRAARPLRSGRASRTYGIRTGCAVNSLIMSVSLVIVNWNSGTLLEQCLRAITQQTIKPTAVFVVDNASTDGSERCVSAFPMCVLLSPGRNLGFAGGNNYALKLCDTDYVLLVNPDAFLHPTCIEEFLAAAQANPDYAAFGARQMLHGRPDTLDGVGDVYHFTGRVKRSRHEKPLSIKDLEPAEIFSPCGAAALYRRRALAEVGYFDEDYFCFVEDVDLGFRLRLAGYRALYVPTAVVAHVGSGTTGGRRSPFSSYFGHRNLVWTFIKNMPGPLLWLLLPAHILVNILAVTYAILGGRGAVVVRAKFDAVRGLRRVLAKRKEIQTRRKARILDVLRVLDKRLF